MKKKKTFTLYNLYIDGKFITMCKDRYLVELYLVQRKLTKEKYEIQRDTFDNESLLEFDMYLLYYYGFAVTRKEYRFIMDQNLEFESNRKYQLARIQAILAKEENELSKKEKKALKNSIKILKKFDSESIEAIDGIIQIVIQNPSIVEEHLQNLDTFRDAVYNEDIPLEGVKE